MYIRMSPLCTAKSEPNELKFGALTMLGVGILQPLQALAAIQIMGVGSENVRGGHENAPKFTSEVNYFYQRESHADKLCTNRFVSAS